MLQNNRTYLRLMLLSGLLLAMQAACSKRQLDIDTIATSEVEIRSVLSKVDSNHFSDDSVFVHFYKSDTLFKKIKINTPIDKVIMPVGDYSVIMLNNKDTKAECMDLDRYTKAKILLKQFSEDSISSPGNIFSYSVNNFKVEKFRSNLLTIEPENLSKTIDYQLVIGGAADSLSRCLVTQPGLARGVIIHNKQLLFGHNSGAKITFDAKKENNYSGKINILGVNPDDNNLELDFTFKNNRTQNSKINISTLVNDDINAKKVIMYIDVSIVNLEMKAILKSWVVIEDSINL